MTNAVVQNDAENLCRVLLEEARKSAEGIVQQAHANAEALLAHDRKEAEKTRQERMGSAQQDALRKREQILASVPAETNRIQASHVEQWLGSIRAEALQQLLARQGFDYPHTLVSAACYAIQRMSGNRFTIALAPPDHAAWGPVLADQIRKTLNTPSLDLTLASDPEIQGGGLMIRDAEGRQEWDNRLPSRLERLWPELRGRLAYQYRPAREAQRDPTGSHEKDRST